MHNGFAGASQGLKLSDQMIQYMAGNDRTSAMGCWGVGCPIFAQLARQLSVNVFLVVLSAWTGVNGMPSALCIALSCALLSAVVAVDVLHSHLEDLLSLKAYARTSQIQNDPLVDCQGLYCSKTCFCLRQVRRRIVKQNLVNGLHPCLSVTVH